MHKRETVHYAAGRVVCDECYSLLMIAVAERQKAIERGEWPPRPPRPPKRKRHRDLTQLEAAGVTVLVVLVAIGIAAIVRTIDSAWRGTSQAQVEELTPDAPPIESEKSASSEPTQNPAPLPLASVAPMKSAPTPITFAQNPPPVAATVKPPVRVPEPTRLPTPSPTTTKPRSLLDEIIDSPAQTPKATVKPRTLLDDIIDSAPQPTTRPAITARDFTARLEELKWSAVDAKSLAAAAEKHYQTAGGTVDTAIGHAIAARRLPRPATPHLVRGVLLRNRIAPFKVTTPPGDDYLVKLVDRRSGISVIEVFVGGGRTAEITVPLGSYTMKYATFRDWYGGQSFGPEASFHKSDDEFVFSQNADSISGHSVELIKQRFGNLETRAIAREEF